MVGKGKAIAHTTAAINYGLVKEKGEVLDKHFLSGETANEITQEFQQFQGLNGRCANNTFSFVLSPSIEDGKKLTDEELRGIANEFLDKSGLSEHQAIVIKHQDREHTHLHIFANRIDMNGKAKSDKHIGRQSSRVANEIAESRNLTQAKVVGIEKEIKREPVKEEVKHRFENAIRTARPRNHEEFWEALKANKIEVKPHINRQGILSGYRVEFGGESFKASEIGNKYSLTNLGKTLVKEIGKSLIQGIGI